MTERKPALDALIREAEARAEECQDPVAVLVAVIKLVIASEADPYLVSGALIAGVVSAIEQRIPSEIRGEVAVEAVRLMRDQFRVHGVI